MTEREVVNFLNHKYGENIFLIEEDDKYIIYTNQSQWIIFKKDFKKFHKYILYHFNNHQGKNYHVQLAGGSVPFLIYYAARHDLEVLESWENFQKSYELFLYGNSICESIKQFDEEAAKEDYFRGRFDFF